MNNQIVLTLILFDTSALENLFQLHHQIKSIG